MTNHESLRDHLRRARHDPGVRAHLLENARYSRSVFRWVVVLFAILACWQTGYQYWREGVWISRTSIFYTFSFIVNWLIYEKFSDRVSMLESMDDVPNHVPDPTFASGTSRAGHEPRHR